MRVQLRGCVAQWSPTIDIVVYACCAYTLTARSANLLDLVARELALIPDSLRSSHMHIPFVSPCFNGGTRAAAIALVLARLWCGSLHSFYDEYARAEVAEVLLAVIFPATSNIPGVHTLCSRGCAPSYRRLVDHRLVTSLGLDHCLFWLHVACMWVCCSCLVICGYISLCHVSILCFEVPT